MAINSGKHTKNGTMVFSAWDDEAGERVHFTVSDNGTGIARENLPHIFGQGSAALYTALSRLNAKLSEEEAQVTISYLRGRGYLLEAV